MTTANTLLHSLRSQQLAALCVNIQSLKPADQRIVERYHSLTGKKFDVSALSDKSLEEIDKLSSQYLDRVV